MLLLRRDIDNLLLNITFFFIFTDVFHLVSVVAHAIIVRVFVIIFVEGRVIVSDASTGSVIITVIIVVGVVVIIGVSTEGARIGVGDEVGGKDWVA